MSKSIYNKPKAGKIRIKMRSRIHVVLLRVSEFHPYGNVMKLIQLRRTPAFLLLIRKFLQLQKSLSLLRLDDFYLMEVTVSRPKP